METERDTISETEIGTWAIVRLTTNNKDTEETIIKFRKSRDTEITETEMDTNLSNNRTRHGEYVTIVELQATCQGTADDSQTETETKEDHPCPA